MPPEIALVVDALAVRGGAEKVLLAALELFPGAPVYALVYDPGLFQSTALSRSQVTTSFINNLPLARRHYRSYLPLMPLAIEQFDLAQYDLIVSFSYAVAHGVRLRPGQAHVSYTHTPMRYAWRGVPLRGRLGRFPWLTSWILAAFRRWDTQAVQRVDHLAAVSCDIASWVRRSYQRSARVIYPPVEVERFLPAPRRESYFITVSRLVAHKRLDLIVNAFSQLKLPLLIVGEGPEYSSLKKMASPNITFAGYQNDACVADLLSRSRGFVYASEEDFGIAVVEAQAAGCPVIAYAGGGTRETVCPEKTGVLFQEQSVPSLVDAVERFERQAGSFCTPDLLANARRFNKDRFKLEFAEFVEQALEPETGWQPPPASPTA